MRRAGKWPTARQAIVKGGDDSLWGVWRRWPKTLENLVLTHIRKKPQTNILSTPTFPFLFQLCYILSVSVFGLSKSCMGQRSKVVLSYGQSPGWKSLRKILKSKKILHTSLDSPLPYLYYSRKQIFPGSQNTAQPLSTMWSQVLTWI